MRLDKYLAENTQYSRSEVKKLIQASRVQVISIDTKKSVKLTASLKLLQTDAVYLDGEQIDVFQSRYIMLNKPPDTVCSSIDEHYPSVLRLLPQHPKYSLKIVGRLDADTTGLLLLTDDGQWLHRVINPSQRHGKCYRVLLAEAITSEQCELLSNGVLLRGEEEKTKPANVVRVSDTTIDLTIFEGRYHQVKRMLAAVGNHVIGLHRLSVGAITLPDDLASGEWRALTKEEILCF